MFEIRVICDTPDARRVAIALRAVFRTGLVRKYPSRTPGQTRLYVRAEHLHETPTWPAPQDAYAKAPNILSEIGWTTHAAAPECFTEVDREYYLRKAALLDRIALRDDPDEPDGDATKTAHAAALMLLDTDRAGLAPDVLARAEKDPRGYARREYVTWQQRQALLTSGRCPNCQWLDYQCNCADHPDA